VRLLRARRRQGRPVLGLVVVVRLDVKRRGSTRKGRSGERAFYVLSSCLLPYKRGVLLSRIPLFRGLGI
jgi:hypothetical protein